MISEPLCKKCGLPFELNIEPGSELLCAACIAEPPIFDSARAVFVYNHDSRDLVLSFKHGDRTEAAVTYGQWLKRVGADMLATTNLVVPVPLHWSRLWRRRYNQAAMLAKQVATKEQLCCDLLIRRRRTASQGQFARHGRIKNVRGAIIINKRYTKRLHGASIVLIDDVMTTGATLNECAKVLKSAGAARVDVLTLARVVR